MLFLIKFGIKFKVMFVQKNSRKKKLISCRKQIREAPSKEIFYTVLNQITSTVDVLIYDNILNRTRFPVEIIGHIRDHIHEP